MSHLQNSHAVAFIDASSGVLLSIAQILVHTWVLWQQQRMKLHMKLDARKAWDQGSICVGREQGDEHEAKDWSQVDVQTGQSSFLSSNDLTSPDVAVCYLCSQIRTSAGQDIHSSTNSILLALTLYRRDNLFIIYSNMKASLAFAMPVLVTLACLFTDAAGQWL